MPFYQKLILRVEYFIAVIAIVFVFVGIEHFAWWWLIVLFFAFDISLVGYVFNPRIGAITYNSVHNLIVPAILLALHFVFPAQWLLFLGLLWLFHVCVDRTIGFGLMYGDKFGHTNLATIRLPFMR
jgi:hypothetical protein